MSKTPIFTLDEHPAFPLAVDISVAGFEKKGKLKLTAKHHPIDEYQDAANALQTRLNSEEDFDRFTAMAAHLMTLIDGWDLPYELTAENMRKFIVHYPSAYAEIVAHYFAELMGFREKN